MSCKIFSQNKKGPFLKENISWNRAYKYGFMKDLAPLWLVLRYQLQLSSHDYERKMEGVFFSLVFTEPQYIYIYYNSKLLVAVIDFADPV